MGAELPCPALCVVTDAGLAREASDAPEDWLIERVEAAVRGGANMIQLRDKGSPADQQLQMALRLKEAIGWGALLFVNGRVDVALAAGADGVQLGERSLPVEAVRSVSGGRLLIGRSVHDIDGARRASSDGCDFLIAGTVFHSHSHPEGTTIGTEGLEAIVRASNVPVIGIGGIDAGNAAEVIQTGATGVAVIRAVLGSRTPGNAAQAIWESITKETPKRGPRNRIRARSHRRSAG